MIQHGQTVDARLNFGGMTIVKALGLEAVVGDDATGAVGAVPGVRVWREDLRVGSILRAVLFEGDDPDHEFRFRSRDLDGFTGLHLCRDELVLTVDVDQEPARALVAHRSVDNCHRTRHGFRAHAEFSDRHLRLIRCRRASSIETDQPQKECRNSRGTRVVVDADHDALFLCPMGGRGGRSFIFILFIKIFVKM